MDIIGHRRALHRIPELDRNLPRTMEYLKNALCGCEILEAAGSLCAFFDFGKDDAIAFRSDADALPISENTGAAYSSQIPGQMHACGHDGHMAILLELARRLKDKKTLPHNILLIFQCAEETTGGARPLCETGVLEKYNVKAIFGLHLWPGLAKGKIFSKPGAVMCSSREIHVQIQGRSAHVAKADEGLDALAAGVEFYRAVQKIDEDEPAWHLLKLCKMESGTVCNAISGHTTLEGTLRSYDDAVSARLVQALHKLCADCKLPVTLRMTEGYPAVCNPQELFEKVSKIVKICELPAPAMTAEDFSHYQKHIPGLFVFLGLGDVPALHRADFDFDDSVLTVGADFFEKLAEEFV